ncbi:MAG: rhodanese-like domain-containing protein [Candidatus Bathyarchaeota archaeon]|nr:rhodanese-like domain-containing protein [Candidatus Bathyarchaeota archaeon]MDP7443093.1 rhodanese-like domain-containing protein [Candidatus Bathyarchaeota archaeon]
MEKQIQIMVIVTMIGLAVAAYYIMHSGFGNSSYGNVDVREARNLLREKGSLMVLDVRTISEYDGGHLQGAINIPVEVLTQYLSQLNKNDELLVYCRTGNRSTTAVGILRENGYDRIYHMDGGIEAWDSAKFPIVS